MGGIGSGGGGRLSDEERKRRGTFREEQSDAVYDERAAAKVITGVWLAKIPEPTLPLGEIGRKKYDELTRQLHSQNKLTMVTQIQAETAGRIFEKIFRVTTLGKEPTASDFNELQRALSALKIAEDAPTITNPEGKENRFSSCGFSNRRDAKVRVQKSSGSRS